jgi:hypothetical protein
MRATIRLGAEVALVATKQELAHRVTQAGRAQSAMTKNLGAPE